MNKIADLRREFNLAGLRRGDMAADPLAQFQLWFEQAPGMRPSGSLRKFFIRLYKLVFLGAESGARMDVNAATLATADLDGRPSARVVLLKGIDHGGFIFFTNYESRKGRELAANPYASMVFYWPDQERQVCIAGQVSKIAREESEAYFKSRPVGSQLGAWASRQSAVVENRAVLEKRWEKAKLEYSNQQVPMPDYWGGYVLIPDRVEFWQGRASRLHDRFCYSRQTPEEAWRIERLSP
jgi:pyridoxamine 5'-phosphate oxidase